MRLNANKIIVIAGPTASGKTSLAVGLAKEIGGEIINADSRSIYRGMDIGTGKPVKDPTGYGLQTTDYLVEGIPHHLFDIKDPDETFSVAEFKRLANRKITEIRKRDHTPIIVGGTGLYIDALVYDFSMAKSYGDRTKREELNKKSAEELFEELEEVDPETAGKIDPKNKRRLIRALEIYHETGKSKSEQEERKPLPENILYFAIDTPREKLYENINKRVEEMFIDENIVNETRGLLERYSRDLMMMQTMGYEESVRYINGEISLEEAIESTQQRHRNLAKRQLTWFRRNKDTIWVKDLKDLKSWLKRKSA